MAIVTLLLLSLDESSKFVALVALVALVTVVAAVAAIVFRSISLLHIFSFVCQCHRSSYDIILPTLRSYGSTNILRKPALQISFYHGYTLH